MPTQTVLEELARDKLTREQVELRVGDWLERLRNLRAQIEEWLYQPEFELLVIEDREPATMNEELMQRFGVRPREMPVFDIKSGSQRVMRVLPKGLWIVGANGRVDLITRTSAPILADLAEPLAGSSNWQLYSSKNRMSAVPLTGDTFRELVRDSMQ